MHVKSRFIRSSELYVNCPKAKGDFDTEHRSAKAPYLRRSLSNQRRAMHKRVSCVNAACARRSGAFSVELSNVLHAVISALNLLTLSRSTIASRRPISTFSSYISFSPPPPRGEGRSAAAHRQALREHVMTSHGSPSATSRSPAKVPLRQWTNHARGRTGSLPPRQSATR